MKQVQPMENDTKVVFQSLINSKSIISTLKQIQGPYSFIYYRVQLHNCVNGQKSEDTVYFGRDPVGRRSLVLHIDMKKQFVSISSTYKTVANDTLTILPSSTIQITPNAYQILYENSYNPGALCFKDIPPYGVFTIRQRRDPSQQIQIDYISTQETDFPCRMNTSITLEEDRMNAASHLLELLEKSIWKCISTYDSITVKPQ